MTALSEKIQNFLSLNAFEAAPVHDYDPLDGLMAYKRGLAKYQYEEGG